METVLESGNFTFYDEVSTLLPTLKTAEEEKEEFTVITIACIVGITITIGLIFLMAVLLDCRQQKIDSDAEKVAKHRRKTLKSRVKKMMPKITIQSEDRDVIVNQMEEPEFTPSSYVV